MSEVGNYLPPSQAAGVMSSIESATVSIESIFAQIEMENASFQHEYAELVNDRPTASQFLDDKGKVDQDAYSRAINEWTGRIQALITEHEQEITQLGGDVEAMKQQVDQLKVDLEGAREADAAAAEEAFRLEEERVEREAEQRDQEREIDEANRQEGAELSALEEAVGTKVQPTAAAGVGALDGEPEPVPAEGS